MKRFLILILILAGFTSSGLAEERENWSNQGILALVKKNFPGAYLQFTRTTWEYYEERDIFEPVSVEIIVPVSVYDKWGSDGVTKRGKRIAKALGGDACTEVTVSDEEEFAWYSFEEKMCRRVLVKFYLGC